MTSSLVPAAGFVLAAIFGGLAFYQWRRATGLYSLLVEGANRFEEMRQRGQEIEQKLAKADEKLKVNREQTARLEKAVDDSRDKAAELVRRLDAKVAENKLLSDKLELQTGTLERQWLRTQEQLRLVEQQRDELSGRIDQITTEADRKIQVARQEVSLKERELASRERELSTRFQKLEKTKASETVDPVELKKMKRRIAQYDRLYASMKGLREMSEERNRNWEVALRKLSTWILRETGGPSRTVPDAIGPLVGQAMQAIGAQLIDDSEIEQAGASRASDMDESELETGDDEDLAERVLETFSATNAKDKV